jgi:hypothetical protein
MAGGNGVELQQRNTTTPYEPARGGIEELIKQSLGTFNANQGTGPQINTGPAYAALRGTLGQDYGGILSRMRGPSSVESNLSGVARGEEVGNNPYFNTMVQQNADEAMRRATSGIGAMGRGGSGLAQRSLAETYSRNTTPYMAQQFNADLARQDAANQAIDAARLGYGGMERGILSDTYNTKLQALGGQTAVQQANIANNDPWRNNQAFANILGSLAPYGTQETFEPPPSPLQMIMGILGTVGGLAGGLLGDQPGKGGGTAGVQSMQPGRYPRTGILGGY